MAEIIVTHAPEAAARAKQVAEKLGALGFTVRNGMDVAGASPFVRRKRAAAIDKADRVLVLWSKDAPPALLEAASRARAKGKLAFARLDAASAPAGLRPGAVVDLSAWSGRETRAWKSLIATLGPVPRSGGAKRAPARAAAAATSSASESRKGGGVGAWIAALLVLGALGAGGYFFALQAGLLP